MAFILLSNSESHVFIVFFKIFFLVVVIGLYFGLAVLPVILSLIGPTFVPRSVAPMEDDADKKDSTAMEPPIEPPTPIKVQPCDKVD